MCQAATDRNGLGCSVGLGKEVSSAVGSAEHPFISMFLQLPNHRFFACHSCGEILLCLQARLGKLLGKDWEEAEMEEECDPLSCDWWLRYFKVKLNF